MRVIDVTHGIARHDLLGAAVVLRNTAPYMPAGAIHLAVVDPGVGGPRRAIVLRSAGDRFFVGPDNGMLVLAAEADGGIAGAWEITNDELFAQPLSATFHGRDIFAPVAARLATGLPPGAARSRDRAGRPRAPRDPAAAGHQARRARHGGADRSLRQRRPEPRRRAARGGELGDPIELVCGGERYLARLARSFVEVRPSDIMVLVDSYGQVALAVNTGSARRGPRPRAGRLVELRRLP